MMHGRWTELVAYLIVHQQQLHCRARIPMKHCNMCSMGMCGCGCGVGGWGLGGSCRCRMQDWSSGQPVCNLAENQGP
jgi:hypothetical protein